MIDRYLLRIVVVLSFLLGLFSPGLEAQEREEVYPKELLNVIMRGAGDPPALPSLDASYCSDDEPIDIYVEETLPPNVTTIQWTVQVNMGGTLVAVSDYHESIGSSPNLGIRLFPDRFSEEHLNRTILISYNIVSGSGSSGKGDYTHVLKKPTVYNLSIDGFESEVDGEICIGESVTLILDGSEVGVNYFLQRDGVNINPFPQEGTGGALSWTNISVGGEYSVLAVNSRSFQFGPDVTHTYQCSSVMNETPFLTVHPFPVPTANSDKSTYCVGEPIQLSGGPDGMASYSWTYPDGAIAEERNPLIASADYSSHNGTYTLTVESADGCINTTTLNVVVNENPTATLPADFDVCEDAPLNFTTTVTGGAGPYSYAWTKDGNPIGTTTASFSVPSASLGDAGVYEVTVKDANGCGAATASISIGVNERPVIGAVSNDGPACEGDESIQLSSSGVTGVGTLSYAWTSPNGYSSSDENPLIGPVTLADAGVYTLVVSDESGCSSDSETTTVVVDALPEATLSGDAAVCVGATGSYTAGGGDQYTFTVLDASNTTVESQGPSASNTFETSTLAVGSYTINVLVENAAGCTAEESVTLTVNAAPEATIAFDPAVICEGESSELVVELTTGAAPWSLSYNDGSGLVSRSGITGLTHRQEVNHTSNVTYTLLSITDANGCTVNPNTTATLTVNERPKVSVESNNDPSNEVCLGGTMDLTATASDGVTPYGYQWYFEGNPISGATGVTYTISNAEAADAGAYSVVVSSSNAGVTCDSDSASLMVTVVEVTAALDGAAGYCLGGTETYTASGGDSYTFTLYDAGNNVIATQATSANDSYTTSAALAAGDYTLEVVVANALGCDDDATLPFTIYPEPAASISFSEPVVCEGDNTTLEIELTAGSTPWSVTYDNGLVDQTVNGITETSFSLEFSPAGDVTYTLVSITDANGCTATPGTTAEVTVNEVPTVGLLSDNDPSNVVCLGSDMVLTATASVGAGNYVYQWTHNGEELPGVIGATYTISNAEAGDAGEYSVVVTDTDNGHVCESAPASLTVVVTEAAGLSGSAEICAGTSEEYTATGGISYLFELLDASDAVIDPGEWDSDATYSTDLALAVGTYTLRVTVEDANGCQAQSELLLEVKESPDNTLTYNDRDICSGESITVSAIPGYSSYIFYVNGDEVQNGTNHEYTSTTFEDGDQVYVIVTDGNNCAAASATIDLIVRPLPEAGITVSPVYAGEGDDVTISGSGGEDYLFLVNGEPYDGESEGWIAGPLTLNTLVNGDELSVIARNEFGCVAESETITMTIDAYPIEFDLLPVYSEYCENDGGATLYLEGHEALTSVEYELYEINDMGNPLAIIPEEEGSYLVWNEVPEGEYRVVARRLPGGLEKEFASVAEVVMNSNPSVFNLVAVENTTICEVSISLSGSESGVYYYLQLDGSPLVEDPIEGNGSSLDFGTFSFGGTYSILAVSLNGCSTEMNNPYLKEVSPNGDLFTVSADPAEGFFCAGSEGVTILTDGSQDGAAYQVYYNGTALGEGVLGNGAPLSFGPYTNEGTYRVVIAGSGGCLYVLDDAITVSEIALPDPVTLSAENDGHFCEGDTEGVELTQTGFQAGVTYALYYEGVLVTDSEWTASSTDMSGSYSYGDFSQAGTYTIEGTTILGECSQQVAEIELVPDSLPTAFELSGDDFYCGPDGQTILTLSGSQSDVEYTLYRDDVPGATQSGNGGLLNFIVDQEGEYRVEAVYIHEYTSCPLAMNGIIQVDERPLPDLTKLVNVDVSGADCTTGAEVTLLASEPGVEYEIYWWADEDNNGPTGSILSGDGSDLIFSAAIIDGGGSYRVQAIKNGCPKFLDEIFTVDIPNVLEKFNITGEGTVCEGEGDGGVEVGLSGSEFDVTYSLLDRDLGTIVGSPINTAELVGYTDGDALSFGIIEEAGNYIVEAISNDGSCSLEMNGVFELRFNPLPEAFRLTGSGTFCDDIAGATIGLNDSENGVLYTLIWDNAGVPRTRGTAIGSGEPLFFEGVSDEGNYTVYARNDFGCTSSMNGTVEVEHRPAPSEALTITANDYCSDGSTGELTVAGHEADVFYHLYSPDASGSLIQTLVSTGGAEDLEFEGLQEGNLYTLYASWEDEACMVALLSDISVSPLDSPEVPVLDPIVENPTCAGEAFISVTNAQEGVVYTLINDELDTQFEINDELDYTFLENEGLLSSFLQVEAVNETTGCRVRSDLFRIEVLDAPGDFELISSVGTVNDGDVLDKCYGDNSFSLMVSNSQPGVLYRLYRKNNDGEKQLRATVEGNGEVVHFNNEVQWPRGTYFVEPTFASTGCVGPMVEFFIEFLYGPHDNDDRPLIIDYIGSQIKVIHPVPALATYELYMGNELIESFITNEPFQEVAWTVNDPGNYHVEAYSEDRPACINKSNTITISDVTPPVAEYWLVDQVLEYCSGDAGGIDVVLTGTTAGVYYELVKLDDDNPEVIQIKKGITDGGDVVFNGVEGTHKYSIWVDGSDEDFKIDTDDKTFVVTENPTPSSFLLSRGGAVNSHEITLFGSEEGVWYWLFRNGNFDSEEMPLVGTDSTLNFGTVNKPGDYSVIAFGEGGCEAEMEGMANIYQSNLAAVNDTLYLSPDDLAGTLDLAENDRFSFIGGLDRFGPGGNLRFNIVRPAKSGAETALDELSGLFSYQKLPSFYGEDFLEYRIENLDVPGRVSNIGRVVIMVGNKDFNENQSFLLPNAFSPNGDGINDRFVISGLGETEESSLEVFNRWGTIVYRSQGKQYNNSWDGTSNVGAMVSIGKELPNGVYFYVYTVKKNVNGSIQTRNYSGYVELRR